jgi:hypothetical protein
MVSFDASTNQELLLADPIQQQQFPCPSPIKKVNHWLVHYHN